MKRNQEQKKNNQKVYIAGKRFYGLLALLSTSLLFVAMLWVEQSATIGLGLSVGVCLVCCASLLFCLIKLDVMEFRAGSFWDRLAQQIGGTAAQSRPGNAAVCVSGEARRKVASGTVERYPAFRDGYRGYKNAA